MFSIISFISCEVTAPLYVM